MDYATRENLLLAPYAMHAAESAGRRHGGEDHPYRSPYQRDRDRIVHSSAYRRLAHKTQVFTGALGDYHRSRLTHTHEVASIARTLARALEINEDLVEALALAHDIGHPPFGHAGEDTLNALLAAEGGFNHNAQALRIVEQLEQRYPGVAGLNLTAEVLEGQRRRIDKADDAGERPLLEVQAVDAADSIAYDAHDADDALELGMIDLGELEAIALWRASINRVRDRYAALSESELRRATIHELLDRMVGDLLSSTRALVLEHSILTCADVRRAPVVVASSAEMVEQRRELESFLFRRVYRHPRVLEHRTEAAAALESLFGETLARLTDDASALGEPYQTIALEQSPARAACDWVASVTDRFALEPRHALAASVN